MCPDSASCSHAACHTVAPASISWHQTVISSNVALTHHLPVSHVIRRVISKTNQLLQNEIGIDGLPDSERPLL